MFKTLRAPLALALAFAATPAFAQDAEESGYNGFYVGGSVGFSAQPNDIDSSIVFDTNLDGTFGDTVRTAAGADAFSPGFCKGSAFGNSPTQGCQKDLDGIDYYGRIGFDRQLGDGLLGGGAVIGIVGEFGKSDIRDSVSAFSSTPFFYIMNRRVKYNGAVRLRAGYTPNNTTLFYATGGGAYAKVTNRFRTSNGVNSVTTNGSQDTYGYSVGGGVEQKISNNISVGVEYIFTHVDDDNARVRLGRGSGPATNPFVLVNASGTDFARSDPNFRWHSARAVANFRF